jgi:hypothetical protein
VAAKLISQHIKSHRTYLTDRAWIYRLGSSAGELEKGSGGHRGVSEALPLPSSFLGAIEGLAAAAAGEKELPL